VGKYGGSNSGTYAVAQFRALTDDPQSILDRANEEILGEVTTFVNGMRKAG
jgi:hypothetical protein